MYFIFENSQVDGLSWDSYHLCFLGQAETLFDSLDVCFSGII